MQRELNEYAAKQIGWIVKARWIITAILTALGVLANYLGVSSVSSYILLVLALIVYAYNFFYSFMLNSGPKSRRTLDILRYMQLICDAFVVTTLIHYTGGIESPFFVLYILIIFIASILLPSKETYFTAVLCAALYSALLLMEHNGIVALKYRYLFSSLIREPNITFLLFVTLAGATIFCTCAFLANHLSIRFERAQEALEDTKWFYHTFVEEMTSGAIVAGETGKIVVFNNAAQEISGFSSQEIIGKSCFVRHGKKYPLHELVKYLANALQDGKQTKRCEVSLKTKSGEMIPVGFNTSLLRRNDDVVIGAAAIFADLSRVKEMESRLRLKDRLSSLGGLASIIAHDMRNPLSIIKVLAELLKKNLEYSTWEDSAQAIADTESICKQVDVCDKTIKELLVFAKPALKVDASDQEKIDLNSLIDALLEDCPRSKQCKNVEIEKKYDTNTSLVVARSEQLRQIFLNLIDNAIEAMPDGGRLLLKTEYSSDAVEIEIADNGPGIAPEVKEHLFEPFYTTKEAGTGLGLSIVQKVILDLGGTINVESAVGKGTTFKVRLPSINNKTRPDTKQLDKCTPSRS